MTAQYQNNVDHVIMVPTDDEDKNVHREYPPSYTTLPKSGESRKHNMKDSTEPTSLMRTARQERSEKKRLKKIFRAVSINKYEII